MKEDYIPNEKYRNMFGVERSGYGCERVDLYLAQLEVAFKKIREDNRNMKRDLSGPVGAPAAQAQQGFIFRQDNEMAVQLEQQGQYIMQLQAQLAEQQEQARRQAAQAAEQQEQARRQAAQAAEQQEQARRQAAAQAAQMAQMAQAAQAQQGDPQATEALMAQIAALRGEADALRRQLRTQSAAAPAYQLSEEEQQGLIGKVLVEARAQAESMVNAARQESELMTHKARQKVDQLRAEQERVHSQLQGISFGLRNVLRESAGTEYQQRGEEYAAS